jgi:uncharacterized protein (UPF0305 family)
MTAPVDIRKSCLLLKEAATNGELGMRLAGLALQYTPVDIRQMDRNFGNKIKNITPEYREKLRHKITEHLLGTYQTIHLRQQDGSFGTMTKLLTGQQKSYWDMVVTLCMDKNESDNSRLRFLKFLLAGFCMLVLNEPGHAVGTPFPGGDTVQLIDGIYYCPVRERANDVDAALCPYCPALQTPEVGYLKPPVNASDHKKQEYIEHIHTYHHFNG